MVVVAADTAPAGFPLGWAQEPDPQCGRRVSIRSQPKRAPRGEVMALGPFRVGGSRPGGGRGPHSSVGQWWDGMGPSRRGAAAIPHAGRSQGRVRGPPFTSPPPHREGRQPRTGPIGRAD